MTETKILIAGGGRAHGKSAGLAEAIAEQLAGKIPAGHEITDIEVDPFAPGATSLVVKTERRGGARPGAGRKPIREEDQRNVTISFRVKASTRDALQELRAQGIDINAELEKMVARLAKRDTKG